MRPRLLDAFCGAGGCSKGYQMAGFHVTGVDLNHQPRYCGDVFHHGDALEFIREHGREFDVIHASPPCQAFSAMRTMNTAKKHADLLTPTRELLLETGLLCVIENVIGAPIFDAPLAGSTAITLCGSMFDLGLSDAQLRRHRLFETIGFVCWQPPCRHSQLHVLGNYGGGRCKRKDRRPRTVTVVGNSGGSSTRNGTKDFSLEERRRAMGIDWMTGKELSQAIPPAYTEFIGKQIMAAITQPAVHAT